MSVLFNLENYCLPPVRVPRSFGKRQRYKLN